MNTKTDSSHDEQPSAHTPVSDDPSPVSGKRPFVEPEVTVPVDVLEATTFFQGLTSNGTD